MNATYRHSILKVSGLAVRSVSEQLICRTSMWCFVAIMLCAKASRTGHFGALRECNNTGVHFAVQDVVRKDVRALKAADPTDGAPKLAKAILITLLVWINDD